MSAKSRNKKRHSILSPINTIKPNAELHSQEKAAATPFETTQLKHLQTMIDHLAKQVLSSMQHSDDDQQKNVIPLLRMYSQYLNLFMKFKDNCFKSAKTKSSNNSTNAPTISNVKDKSSPNPKMKADHPVSGENKRSLQIQESIKNVMHNNGTDNPLKFNPVNGLMMPLLQRGSVDFSRNYLRFET